MEIISKIMHFFSVALERCGTRVVLFCAFALVISIIIFIAKPLKKAKAAKFFTICGVWLIPCCVLCINLKEIIVGHIGSSSQHAWIATLLQAALLISVIACGAFIILGIVLIFVKIQKSA